MFQSAPVVEKWSKRFCIFVFVFCVFLHENNTKQYNFNTFRKLREAATIIVLWEIWPKKESAYLKREINTDRLQKNADRLQKSAVHYQVYW